MSFFKYLLFILFLLTGCINSAQRTIAPIADLSNIHTIHVKQFPADSRRLDKIIASQLNLMGYQASIGEQVPENVDAIITYRDKWRWDMTMYMLSISIKIREPETGFPLATGNSLHTSISRKTPSAMINEVLTNMLSQEN